MATTFSGIASGIDSASIISSLMSVAKQPVTRLQTKQTTNNTMSKKFTDLKTKMAALQTAAKALDTRSEAMVNKVTSSKIEVLGATTTGGASLGTFGITVGSVAQSERTYSDGFTSSTQAGQFSAGTLSIQVGTGTATDIDVTADDTLETIANKINNKNLGVTAGLVYNGSQYRLQVSSNKTGTDNKIEFAGGAATALGLDKPANEFQAAANAQVTIDNITVSSQTNAVTGAIPGVTLNVLSQGTSNVTIDRDADGLKTKLDAFTKAYNDVMTVINAESAATGGNTPKAAGSLSGDSTLRSVQSDMRSLMSQSLEGLSSSFATMGALGVSVGRDGMLSVDAEKLKTAVTKDFEGVTAALVGVGGSKGLMGQLVDKLDPYTRAGGTISSRITNLSERNHDIDDQIDRLQVRLDKYEEGLQAQYASLESLMGSLKSQGSALSSILGY